MFSMGGVLSAMAAGVVWLIHPMSANGQSLPAPDDSRHSILREAMLGLLSPPVNAPDSGTQHHCLVLPAAPANDGYRGPKGIRFSPPNARW